MPGGNVGWGVAVDLSAMAHIRVDEDGAAVGPGVLAGSLARHAEGVHRFFPALPSSAERCTVGGMVANNAAGARSFRYGSVRAFVDGLDVVLADGTGVELRRGAPEPRFTALRDALARQLGSCTPPWPKVRKNASGYALDHFLPQGDAVDLLVGSEGTLGIVTAIRLRLIPRPLTCAVALVALPDLAALEELAQEARRVGAVTCEFLGGAFLDIAGLRTAVDTAELVAGSPALAIVEVDGTGDEVTAGLEALERFSARHRARIRVGRTPEETERIWRLRHAASPVIAARPAEGLVSMQFIEDSVVPPGDLTRYLSSLGSILEDERTEAVIFGHAGDGNVHVNPLVDVRRPDWRERVRRILERTVELVAGLGGTLSGEHGDGRLRAPFHGRIFGEAVERSFRSVKATLDPESLLNPGVVVPLEGQDPLFGLVAHRRAVR